MTREEILQTVLDQTREVNSVLGTLITCGGCKRQLKLRHQFRCFYCHVFFCAKCAPNHFGPEHDDD